MSQVPEEIKQRIIGAANQLYSELGGASFPKVDDVRKLAKADMNSTSVVMKEWRKLQSKPLANVENVQVPDAIQAEFSTLLAQLWQSAQESANDALVSARKGWQGEQEEAELLREEMATAFEAQTNELDAIKQALADEESKHETTKVSLNNSISTLQDTIRELESNLALVRSQLKDEKLYTDELKEERSELQSQLSEAEKLSSKFQEQAHQLTNQLATKDIEIEKLKTDITTQGNVLNKLTSTNSQQAKDIEANVLALAKAEKNLNAKALKVDELQQKLLDAAEEKASQAAELARAQTELDATTKELSSKDKTISKLESELEKAKAKADKAIEAKVYAEAQLKLLKKPS